MIEFINILELFEGQAALIPTRPDRQETSVQEV